MLGFAILLGFNLLGEALRAVFSLPLPGNVIGLILFAAALGLKWIRLEWVEETSQFLLKHMMLFFAPIIVGVVSAASLIKNEWLGVAAGLLLSTALAVLLTGFVTQSLIKKEGDRG